MIRRSRFHAALLGWRLLRQAFDHFDKALEWLGADKWAPVNYKGWCALYANLLSGGSFLFYNVCIFPGVQALIERRSVQAELFGESFQVILTERALVFSGLSFKQQIVVLPELILICCTLAGFGCPFGFIA